MRNVLDRRAWIVGLVAVSLGVVACSSDDDGAREASNGWPAGQSAQSLLGVDDWELGATGADYAFVGLGDYDDTTTRLVRVDARMRQAADGSLTVDVELPEPWHFSYVPGQLPKVSGAMPPSVALALASSALDAPAGMGATAPRALTGTLTPRTSLSGPSTCLVVNQTQLVGASQEDRAGRLLAMFQRFEECKLPNGNIPDVANPAERDAANACIAAVDAAGCGGDTEYRELLAAVQARATTQTTAAQRPQYGLCVYQTGQVDCSRPVRACTTETACATGRGTWTAGGACGRGPARMSVPECLRCGGGAGSCGG